MTDTTAQHEQDSPHDPRAQLVGESNSTDLLCDDIFLREDMKSQVGIDGESKGAEYCKVYDDQWRDLIRLLQIKFLKKALEIVLKEPEYISNSQSTRQGYVRAVNDMERALKKEFQVT